MFFTHPVRGIIGIAYSNNISAALRAGKSATRTFLCFAAQIFSWNKHTQSILLSSFFWGYLVMQIPASQLAQRFGARLFLSGAMVGTGLFTLLLPVAATQGDWAAVAVARACSGLCQVRATNRRCQ